MTNYLTSCSLSDSSLHSKITSNAALKNNLKNIHTYIQFDLQHQYLVSETRSLETEPINSWLTSGIMRMDRLPRRQWFTRANQTADMCTTKSTLINTHGCSHNYTFIMNLALVNTVHDWLKGKITGYLFAFDQHSSVEDRTTNIKERN